MPSRASSSAKHPREPRLAAALALGDVLAGRSLSDSLPMRSAALQGRDRALAAELAYGSCRWFWRLDALGERLLHRPLPQRERPVRALLLVGLYQLLYTRVPAHAAVAETAGAARALGKPWATGLLNAALRRLQREQADLLDGLDDDPVTRYALPGWLIAELRAAWPQRWEQLCAALNLHPPMTLRVNLQRISRPAYAASLGEAGVAARPLPGLPAALTLDRALDVQQLPGFADGLVSVQDAGAQYAAPLLDLAPGQRVLDACAAPGGKTGHLLECRPDLQLTAVDLEPARLARVQENLQRLGLPAELRLGDAAAPAADWAQPPYQRILLDVPCSATGVLRRHPDIRLLRRAADIPALAQRQDAILDAMWPLLQPGGKLLYVTCSLMPVENELRIESFMQRHQDVIALPLPGHWGEARGPGRQLLPSATQDGFFYALLGKGAR
ncbi:MAG: hypothetical protein RLZ44_1160 [Pseudomonadota bacterium]